MPPDPLETAEQLIAAGKLHDADAVYTAYLAANPGDIDALFAHGTFAARTGRFPLAANLLNRALAIDPNDPDVLRSLAMVQQFQKQHDHAVATLERLVSIDPSDVSSHVLLGNSLLYVGRGADALGAYYRALELDPNNASCLHHLGSALVLHGRISEAVQIFRKAFAIDPTVPGLASSLVFNLNYDDTAQQQDVYDTHVSACTVLPRPSPPPLVDPANRKIRIGYLSPDFRAQSIAFFIPPILTNYNRNRFEAIVYADVHNPDLVTDRLRAKRNIWRDIRGMSDDQVDSLIRADKIDILMDLAVHIANNRITVVARKPAPIVVNYLGYPNTSGHPAYDYRIIDDHVDPPGLTERFHSEKLLRLPNSFLCFVIPKAAPPAAPPPCLTRGHITFGCFNNILKITPLTVALWSKVLRAIPTSRLVLKSSYRADPAARQVLLDRFAQNDIDLSRLTILDREDTLLNHLLKYGEMDIAFDTLPYSGATTTSEALYMGVPVISLPGPMHVSRVGITLLTNAGLPHLIAKSSDDFVAIAQRLASDAAALSTLRQSLRQTMSQSPLCDSPTHVRNMESLYEQMLAEKWTGQAR